MNEKNIFGMLNSDGSIASWPEVNLNGQAVALRENGTRAQVDATRFVIMPVNMEFTEELREALQGGYNGLLEWRNKTVLAPVVGFTQVDDDGNPIASTGILSTGNTWEGQHTVATFDAPPVETFPRKSKGAIVDDTP